MWYEINCQLAAKDQDWRILINKSEDNWFLNPKNKSRFGNYVRIARIVFTVVVIQTIPTSTYLILKTWHWQEVDDLNYLGIRIQSGILTVIPGVIIACIWYNIPALNDNYWIFGELKYILRIGFAVFVIQCGIVLFSDPQPQSFMYLVFLSLTTLCTVLVIHVMTIGVFIKRRTFNIDSAKPTVESFDVLVKADDEPEVKIDLRTLLEHEQGFESFMRWLAREWSTENLLFMLETAQYQQLLIKECDTKSPYALDRKATMDHVDINIDFPHSCPNSDIVFDDETNYATKAKLLFDKYVANDAVFLINIAHSTKKRMANILSAEDDANPQALTRLFNKAQREIWNVMIGSFQRYQKTESHKLFVERKRSSIISKLAKVKLVSNVNVV